MNNQLKNIAFWIVNLLTFSKPTFLDLEHIDFIVDKKAFFLISWRIQKAYKIHISELKFQSFEKHGSAYIGVPQTVNEINIKVSNSWSTKIVPVKLIRTEIDNQTDFNVKLNCNEFNKKSVLIPQIRFEKQQPNIKPLKFELKNINAPKIINLNYS